SGAEKKRAKFSTLKLDCKAIRPRSDGLNAIVKSTISGTIRNKRNSSAGGTRSSPVLSLPADGERTRVFIWIARSAMRCSISVTSPDRVRFASGFFHKGDD